MFYFSEKYQDKYVAIYQDVLKIESLNFGNHPVSIAALVEKQVFHIFFQIIFLDVLRTQRRIEFKDIEFSIEIEPTQLIGVASSLNIHGDPLKDEFINLCLDDEIFVHSLKTHSLWLKFQKFFDVEFDGDKANLIALAFLIRHLFWQKKLATHYLCSVEDQASFGHLVQATLNVFNNTKSMTLLTESLLSSSDARVVHGIPAISELSVGITNLIPIFLDKPQGGTVKQSLVEDDDDPFEFDVFDIEPETTAAVDVNTINLSFRSKNYKDFISKVTLVAFARGMINSNSDLKTSADELFRAINISSFDVLAAVFACPFVAEVWAKKFKKTANSLIFPNVIYSLFEQMPQRYSIRTYDHPKRGNTIHSFRHLIEFEEGIHKKFVEYLKSEQWPVTVEVNEQNFAELLWDLLIHKTDCEYSHYFFQCNKTQTLKSIKDSCAEIESYLREQVKGQPEALRQIVNAEMWSRFKSSKGLRGLFTFLGPSGVGKTHLAKTYADALNLTEQSGYKILMFNMENYTDEKSSLALIGAGSQYTDAGSGELTHNVALYPRRIILFDEIEKAHPSVIQTLLTLIDTGRLIDATSMVEVDFSQCVVIFTSNLGHEVFDKAKDLGELDVFDVLRKAKLRNSNTVALSPEFVNRLGAGSAVRFLPLNTNSLLDIATMQVDSLDDDDDGLIDYMLDADLAAILLFSQLPNPTVRGLKAKQINIIAEAKQLLFTMPELDPLLEQFSQLQIEVDAECFHISQQVGRVLVLGELQEHRAVFVESLAGYNLVDIAPLTADYNPISTSKINAIVLINRMENQDFLNEQLGHCQKFFSGIPVFLFSQFSVKGNYVDAVWQQSALSALSSPLRKMKLMIDVHRRLQMAKQKQQGFSYKLELAGVNGSRVTFVVTKPEFNLQISSRRAEEGVTGLVKERPDLRLHQVIGLQRAKTHLKRVIKWLKQPELLASQNIAFPAGMLLAGSPGTGKTMLAKAVAGECELPFISLSVGDLISGIKNGTAENIDRAFKQAADIAPCIMFIDEIDTIATARRAGEVSDNNAVNVLLTHLDGIQKRAEPIFVLAATNFPQALDPALLRAGRLDEIIYCDLPDKAARQDFFDQLSAKYAIRIDKIEQRKYVGMTQGMSGAQIDKIFRDYLYRMSTEDGAQQQESAFMPGLFREAIINISYGSANPDKTLSDESKLQVAWHEAGHLLLTKLLLPQHAIKFATIEPRNHAYGFISTQRDEGVGSNTASEVRAQIAVAMAGREAERLRSINYDVTSGAVGDIETATRYAMHAVCDWGLDPEFGHLNASVLNYQTISADMQQLAEQRIRHWLDEGRQTAAKLLNQHRPLLERIAEQLIESESLYEDQIADFFESYSLQA